MGDSSANSHQTTIHQTFSSTPNELLHAYFEMLIQSKGGLVINMR